MTDTSLTGPITSMGGDLGLSPQTTFLTTPSSTPKKTEKSYIHLSGTLNLRVTPSSTAVCNVNT